MKMTEDKNLSLTIAHWEDALGCSGYRLTRPRRAILRVIAGSSRPLTPVGIFDQARALNPSIGLVTVYRTIDRLVDLNLVERVHLSNSCQTIFRGTQEHRHLLVCSNCGNSAYFDGLDIEEKFSEIGQTLGYQVTHHWLQLEGLCRNCQERSSS